MNGLKKLLVVLMLLVVSNFAEDTIAGNYDDSFFNTLYSLYDNEEFFRFRNMLEASGPGLESWQILYFEALYQSINNKPNRSNEFADSLINNFSDSFPDSLKKDIYSVMITNYVHLRNYKKAMEITQTVLNKFGNDLKPNEKENYLNTGIIWEILKDLPPQIAEIKGDTKLKFGSSFAGKTINVKINGDESEFIFDTGANFSVVMKSYAKKVGIKILKGTFKVNSVTGTKVDSEVGYAEEVKIGNMIFRNVVFLVFPDEALTFSMGLSIEAIIGFPIIRDMREIRISEDGMFIPLNPDTKAYNNFLLNGFSPIIEMLKGKDSLSFAFDTGAKRTMLYQPYYNFYKSEIDGKYEPEEIKVEGAGGAKYFKGFKLNNINLKTANVSYTLEDVDLISESIEGRESKYFGNLGRDYIWQYRSYTINFETMFIDFKK